MFITLTYVVVWHDWFSYWLMNEWSLVLDIMFCDEYDGLLAEFSCLAILEKLRSSHYAIRFLSKLWTQKYFSYAYYILSWTQCIWNERCDVMYYVKKRKEIIGYGPSKGKVIYKDKISGCNPSKGKVTHKKLLYFGGTRLRSFPI